MLVLIVSLRVIPEMRQQFLQAIQDDAECSVRDEVGCLRFDVFEDRDETNHFVFNEIYHDDEALQQHAKTSHYDRWRKTGAPCIVNGVQDITRCATVFPAVVSR